MCRIPERLASQTPANYPTMDTVTTNEEFQVGNDRVSRALKQRLAELKETQGVTQSALIPDSGVSGTIWSEVVNGKRQSKLRPEKAEGISVAVGWTADSIDRVRAGGEPVVNEPDDPRGMSSDEKLELMIGKLGELTSAVQTLVALQQTRDRLAETHIVTEL